MCKTLYAFPVLVIIAAAAIGTSFYFRSERAQLLNTNDDSVLTTADELETSQWWEHRSTGGIFTIRYPDAITFIDAGTAYIGFFCPTDGSLMKLMKRRAYRTIDQLQTYQELAMLDECMTYTIHNNQPGLSVEDYFSQSFPVQEWFSDLDGTAFFREGYSIVNLMGNEFIRGTYTTERSDIQSFYKYLFVTHRYRIMFEVTFFTSNQEELEYRLRAFEKMLSTISVSS